MTITVHYQPSVKTLARASSLFLEKKPLFMVSIGFFNVITGLFLSVIFLKWIVIGFALNEVLTAFAASLWLFGRRPFNEWLLFQRMRRSKVIEKPITIEISRNGIIWSGKGLRPGNMPWESIKYMLQAKNGFILPNAFTKFLWLPIDGFDSSEELQAFKELIIEKEISTRNFPKWEC